MVSSSVKTQRPASRRSISSTLISLFRSNTVDDSSFGSDKATDSTQDMKRRRELLNTVDESNDDNDDSIILYESTQDEGHLHERPPVLPILPKQRLKLLRYKQMKRLQRDFKELNELKLNSAQSNRNVKSKLKSISSQPEKKRRKLAGGKKWVVNYEYDVSEFDDNEKKNSNALTKKSETSLLIDTPKINLTSSRSGVNDVEPQTLSRSESKLLFSIPASKDTTNKSETASESVVKIKQSTKSIDKEKNTPDVILPTIGFDFVKDGEDTPSKKAVITNKTSINILNQDKNDSVSSKKPFNFGISSKSEKANEKQEVNISNILSSGKETPKKDKISFSFGTKPSDNDNKSEPALSLDSVKKSENKPVFSFGSKDSSNNVDIPKAKPSFSFGNTSNNKPSFTFGAFSAATEAKETIQSNGSNVEGEDDKEESGRKRKKPAQNTSSTFSFSLGKPSSDTSTTDKKADDIPTPSFSFGAPSTSKPSESLTVGKPNTSSEKATPSFSFGKATDQTDGNKTDTPKPFTFGSTSNTSGSILNENTGAPETSKDVSKPSFTFGAPSSQPKESSNGDKLSKPAFTFGLPDAASSDKQDKKLAVGGLFKSSTTNTTENASASKPSFSFSLEGKKDSTPAPATGSPAFSFSKPGQGASAPPSSIFGGKEGDKPQQTNPLMGGASGGFKFNKDSLTNIGGTNSATPASVFGSSTGLAGQNNNNNNNNNAGKPAFSFGAGASATPSTGFSFGNAAPNAAPNPTFSQSQSPTPFGQTSQTQSAGSLFGNAQAGQTPPAQNTFKPSNVANFNFMSGASNVNPSSIFQPAAPQPTPQQIFGGSSAPAPMGGIGGVSNPFTAGGNTQGAMNLSMNNNMGMGMNPVGGAPMGGVPMGGAPMGGAPQAPPAGFPQRKLARMRQRR